MSNKTSQKDKFVVRFPDDMRDEVAARAARNYRSMNQEVVASMDAAEKLERHQRETEVTQRCYVDRIKLLEATIEDLLKAGGANGPVHLRASEILAAKH